MQNMKPLSEEELKRMYSLSQEEMQQMFFKQQQKRDSTEFLTGLKVDIEVDNKCGELPNNIEKTLNECLELSNYVDKDKIKQIMFVFQIFNHDRDKKHNIVRTEEVYHSRKFKQLKTYPLLSEYEKFLNADNQHALQMLANETLKAIEMLKKHKIFDYKKMYNDTKRIFIEKNIL